MRAERRQRGRLLQHPLGQVGLHPHPLPLAGAERPALVPDRVRDTEPPEVVHQPGPPQRSVIVVGSRPSCAARRCRELGDGRASVAERVRRLEVDEVGDRAQRRVELARRRARRRAPARRRSPRPRSRTASSPPKISLGVGAQQLGRAPDRTALPPRRSASAATPRRPHRSGGRPRRTRRAGRSATRSGRPRPLELPRPAPPVPLLVRRRRAPSQHRRGQPELLRQASGPARVLGDHVVDVAVARERELEPDPEPVQRRAARRRAAACAAATSRTLRNSWSYLPDFSAMSSPNHLACSWASE